MRHSRCLFLILAVVFVLTTVPSRADVRAVAQKGMAATVWIEWRVADQPAYACGTILSADGLIVTTLRTPSNADEIRVHLYDGRALPAKLLVADTYSKLALLKVAAQDLKFANVVKDQTFAGDMAIAVTAAGPTDRLVSRGIVSATDRRLGNGPNILQSDVRVETGSAGAPLLDDAGDLIGIIAGIHPRDGNHSATIAVPAAQISRLLKHRDTEKVVNIQPGFLGVTLQPSADGKTTTVAQAHPGSPAEKAGLKKGDVILKLNDRKVATPEDVQAAVAVHTEGTTVTMVYQRGDREASIAVILGEHPRRVANLNPALKIERVQAGHWEYVLPDGRRIRWTGESAPRVAVPVHPHTGPQAAIDQAMKRIEQNRAQVQPPAIRVLRADSDKRIDQLMESVRALQSQVGKLAEQLKRLQEHE